MLKIDDLETEIASENPEIQKRFVSFENAEIPVYDLKGIPFSILSTTIDYRSANKSGEIGTDTFRRILENPAIWTERRDEAEKSQGFGTRNSDARGDTISTSYWNSERNVDSYVPGQLIYGFEGVEADSIISVSNGDGGTENMAGRAETSLPNPDVIQYLEGPNGTDSYNEVLLRRYTENGIPKNPDYIITLNGAVTEVALKHAKYFNIPIINIEKSVYYKKMEDRGRALINSINEEDAYEDLDRKITELLSMSEYKNFYHTREGIGRNYDDIPMLNNIPPLAKECFKISKMEQLKRLDFIKNTLEETIQRIESSTKKGVIASERPPQFKYFSASIMDVHNKVSYTEHGSEGDARYNAPGNCNWIDIGFVLKGGDRYIKTRIYDGERVFEANKAPFFTEEDRNNADSSFYDALEPVVRRYFEACQENQKLASKT